MESQDDFINKIIMTQKICLTIVLLVSISYCNAQCENLYGTGSMESLLSSSDNNNNAIRTDNLIRRLLKMPQRDGSDHSGYKEGQIKDPQNLPLTK